MCCFESLACLLGLVDTVSFEFWSNFVFFRKEFDSSVLPNTYTRLYSLQRTHIIVITTITMCTEFLHWGAREPLKLPSLSAAGDAEALRG